MKFIFVGVSALVRRTKLNVFRVSGTSTGCVIGVHAYPFVLRAFRINFFSRCSVKVALESTDGDVVNKEAVHRPSWFF